MLVALHGFTEIDLSWREVLAPLGLDLRTPLLPGHGHNPCPPGTTIAGTAGALAAALPDSFDLLGYSMGGRLALQTALDHPARVRRLVLIGTRPGLRDSAARRERRERDEALAQILDEDGIGAFVAWWESQKVLKPVRRLPEEAVEELRYRRLNQDARGLAACLRCLGQGTMDDLRPRLAALTMPVLLVHGACDPGFVEDMAEMERLIPHARRVAVADCGHAVHREAPQELLDTVHRFLSEP